MKKPEFDKQFAALATASPELHAELVANAEALTASVAKKAAENEALTASIEERDVEIDALTAEIAELKKDSTADRIVKGSYKAKGGKKYGFVKGSTAFRFRNTDHVSVEALKDAELMETLIEIGYSGLEVVK